MENWENCRVLLESPELRLRPLKNLETPSRNKGSSSSSRSRPLTPSKSSNVPSFSPNVAIVLPQEKDLPPACDQFQEEDDEDDDGESNGNGEEEVDEDDDEESNENGEEEVDEDDDEDRPHLRPWPLESVEKAKINEKKRAFMIVMNSSDQEFMVKDGFTLNEQRTVKTILYRDMENRTKSLGAGIIFDNEILWKRMLMVSWVDNNFKKKEKKLKRTLVLLPTHEECKLWIDRAFWKPEVKVTHFIETTSKEELEVDLVVTTLETLVAQRARKSVLDQVSWHRVVITDFNRALERPQAIHCLKPSHIYIVDKNMNLKSDQMEDILTILNLEPAPVRENVDKVMDGLIVNHQTWLDDLRKK